MDIQTLAQISEVLKITEGYASKKHVTKAEAIEFYRIVARNIDEAIEREEEKMIEEAFLRDSDGSACLGVQVA